MIGLLIFGFILVCAFYAWFPNYIWLIKPVFIAIAVIWLVIRALGSLPHKNHSSTEHTLDEFDRWQDNQGL